MTPPEILFYLASAYLLLGLVFAIPFAFVGAARIDADAQGAGWGFRVLVIPGAVFLWPLLARRWRAGTQPPEERTPHKCAVPSEPREQA